MQVPPLGNDEAAALAPRLERVARALVTEVDGAEDLVQDAWLAALRAGSVRQPLQWMKVVMRRRSTRLRAREFLRRESEQFAARSEVEDEQVAERLSAAALVVRELDALGQPYRDVIRQRFIDERSIRDIADDTGRTAETVRSQVSRGLAQMRQRLDRRAGSRELWAGALLSVIEFEHGMSRLRDEQATTAGGGKAPAQKSWWFGSVAAVVVATIGTTAWFAQSAKSNRVAAAPPPPETEDVPAAPTAGGPSERRAALGETAVSAGGPNTPAAPEPAPVPENVARLRLEIRDAVGAPVAGAFGDFIGRDRKPLFTGEIGADGVLVLDVERDDLVDEHWLRGGIVLSVRSDALAWSDTTTVRLELGRERGLVVTLDEPSCALAGRIVDSDGAPVAGALVDASALPPTLRAVGPGLRASPKMVEVRTDIEGRFRIDGLPHRLHSVRIIASGSPLRFERITPDLPDAVSERTITLERGGVVGGFVRYRDGSPAAGARVWVASSFRTQRLQPETRAEEDGFYVLSGVAPDAPVRVFACAASDPTLFDSSAVTVEAGGEAAFDAVLERTNGVRVLVVDDSQAPVPGALVVAAPESPVSDWTGSVTVGEDGRGILLHAPDEPLELRVYTEDFLGRGDERAFRSGVRPSLRELTLTIGREPPLACQLNGRVLRADGRAPSTATALLMLEGFAELDAVDSVFMGTGRFGQAGLREAAVGEDGAFRFQMLDPGRYHLYVVCDEPGGAGVVDGGLHVAVMGETTEIGTLNTPAATATRFSVETNAGATTLTVRARLGPYARIVTTRSVSGPLDVPLYPGSYVAGFEQSQPTAQFQVIEGQPSTVVLDRP